MEAVQSTTYCPVCLKCSTSQPALRPLRQEWKKSSTTFAQVCARVALPFLFCPLRYLSLSHLLPSPSIPPFLFLSPERKNKQLSGSGLQMNSKWLWRAEGPTNFLQRSARLQTCGPRACKQAHREHQINMAISSTPTCIHTNVDCSCSLNQYCILSRPTVKAKEACVWICASCTWENARVCAYVRVAKACSHVMTQMPPSSINRNALCLRSLALAQIYFRRIKSSSKLSKDMISQFHLAGVPPVAQFAALTGSRWVDESLFILSIISMWYLSSYLVCCLSPLSITVCYHSSITTERPLHYSVELSKGLIKMFTSLSILFCLFLSNGVNTEV